MNLTYKQAAKKLQLSYSLVKRYVHQGRLGQHYGTGYVITLKDIEEFKKVPRPRGRPVLQKQ
jgi:excisionase family DNA binding protein